MHTALSIVSTVTNALTATPYVLPSDPDRTRLVRVWTSSSARVAIGNTATEGDLPIAASTPLLIDVAPGQTVAVVKGAGQADGTIWASVVKRV